MNSDADQSKMAPLASFLCHLAFWFGPFFATPVFITLTNPEDIVLSTPSVALTLFLFCLLMSLAGWAIARMIGPRTEWWSARIMLALAFVLAIQGNIVHDLFYYGEFNGETVNFRTNPMLFNIEKWGYLVAFPLMLLALSRIRNLSGWLPVLPIVSFSLLLFPAWMTRPPPISLEEQHAEIDASAFEFSSTRNLIHLLPDGFQGDVVREVLQESPELAARFAGFTLYTHHVGLYQGTAPALYTILTGKPFDLEGGYEPREVYSDIVENSYPRQLAEAGFQLDYVPIAPWICVDTANTCYSRPFNDMKARGLFRHHNEDSAYAARLIADLSLFRLTPRWLKEMIYDDGNWFISDTTADGSSPWPDPVLREWTENLTINSGKPVYKWHHFIGTHMPARWDRTCQRNRELEHTRVNYKQQAYCVLNGIAGLLDKMRSENIYDQSAFIISGDHGHNIYPDDMTQKPINGLFLGLLGSGRPALLVKPRGQQGPITYSTLPTTLADIAPTALELAGVATDSQTALTNDFDTSRERYFTPYSIPHLYSGDPIPFVRYRVGHPITDGSQWVLKDMQIFGDAPTEYPLVNYNSANGFVQGAVLAQGRPDDDSAWLKYKHLAFLINIPDPSAINAFQFTLNLPDWIPSQKLQLEMNGGPTSGVIEVGQTKRLWQDVIVPIEPGQIKEGNNFVKVIFDRTYPSPKQGNWGAAALLQSIRAVMVEPTTGASEESAESQVN